MAEYTATVPFILLGGVSTENAFMDILPPSNVSIMIKRIKVSFGSSTDNSAIIRVMRTSGAMGGTTTTVTPVRLRPDSPASVCTITVKNSSTAGSPGTLVDLVMLTAVNGKASFEWIARDRNDFITSGVNQRVCISLEKSSTAASNSVEMDWVE